jgi:predicted ester cyclase
MSTESNKALIRRYLDDFRADSGSATLDRYVADVALREHIAMYNQVLPGYYLDAEDMVAEGDKVVVRATVRGVHAGPFMDTPPTGKSVAFPLMIIYRVADERIVEHWMVVDMLSFMQQIGATPTPAAATA